MAERSPLIAIVDDDPAAREALVGLVKSLGLDALGFGGADEFLRSESLAAAGCLIADYRMPNVDGLELHRRLRARQATIPTILISAHLNAELEGWAQRAGIVACLAKPVDPDQLFHCLRQALELERNSPS